jgi:hypothetical protein
VQQTTGMSRELTAYELDEVTGGIISDLVRIAIREAIKAGLGGGCGGGGGEAQQVPDIEDVLKGT